MFHHSSILARANVASAGELRVVSGKITYANNWPWSGNYRPDAALAKLQLVEALHRLEYTESTAYAVGEMENPSVLCRMYFFPVVIGARFGLLVYVFPYNIPPRNFVILNLVHEYFKPWERPG
jgi:hypothetical protein